MPKKRNEINSQAGVPSEIDDLKLINGIGTAIESRLNKVGIFTFAQLAMLTPADITEAVSGRLSAQQISAQDWIGQARKLAAQATEAKQQSAVVNAESDIEAVSVEPVPRKAIPVKDESHKAVPIKAEPYKVILAPAASLRNPIFTVEFGLNADSTVHSVHVLHIQSRREMNWEGWQDTALLGFFALHGKLKLPQHDSPLSHTKEASTAASSGKETTPPLVEEASTTSLNNENTASLFQEQIVAVFHKTEEVGQSFTQQIEPAPLAMQKTAQPADVKPESALLLDLRKLEVLPHGANHTQHMLLSEQLFDVRLTLDWDMTALIDTPPDAPLDYAVSLFAKKLGDGYSGCIGQARGTIIPAKSATVKVEGMNLPQGTYRLEAHAVLTPVTAASETASELSMLKKSHILHIS